MEELAGRDVAGRGVSVVGLARGWRRAQRRDGDPTAFTFQCSDTNLSLNVISDADTNDLLLLQKLPSLSQFKIACVRHIACLRSARTRRAS